MQLPRTIDTHRRVVAVAVAIGVLAAAPGFASTPPPDNPDLGAYVMVSWNDLGMHCMNLSHANFSILPPYNNLKAQVVKRGDVNTLPQLVMNGVTVEYSIPGNTYSVGKTDFWTYAFQLFGVNLPPNIGLTGKGLTGTLDPATDHFEADGIPITPFSDSSLHTEDPFQQALLIARDSYGTELTRSTPVIPVSSEISCLASGCHTSENQIIQNHPREGGFNPAARPILCARCHADPALGTTGNPEAYYFSFRVHDEHSFMDQRYTGTAECYMCHPGPNTKCLRDVMSQQFGLVCQDCHGNVANVASSIEQGRTPWLQEPACRTCHTAQFGEPVGSLYKLSAGHGGVMCSGCHGSPHAVFPSREARDNQNNVNLQGHAGTLNDCSVCHGYIPSGAGPHGLVVTSVAQQEIMGDASPLRAYPNPTRGRCTLEAHVSGARSASGSADGRMLIYDAGGRLIRLLHAVDAGSGTMRAEWDGKGRGGEPVAAGVYFARWQDATHREATRLLVVR